MAKELTAEEKAAAEQAAADKKAAAKKPKRFRCEVKCHWNGVMYREGDEVELTEAPEYFKEI